MNPYQKILVGIDGSSQSKLALDKAIELAKLYNAQLMLVTVENDGKFAALATETAVSYRIDPIMLQEARNSVQTFMNQCVKKAKDAGVDVTSKVYYGDSKLELAQHLPESENIDLIVIGATGLNRIERMLIGSNTSYVVQNAKCDVMIVKK
ncbi:universal stress protein [Paucilactobacillus sp. N302-9]